MREEGYSLFFKQTIPLIMVATDSASTVSITIALVIADKVSISALSSLTFTMMSVFCSVRIDTSASIKLIVRSRRTRLSMDFFLFLRLTDAIMILYVVYAAKPIAGINVILTGFCRTTIRDTGMTRQMFKKSSNADAIR